MNVIDVFEQAKSSMTRKPSYRGCFELGFESLRNPSNTSGKQIFRDILEIFSSVIMKIYNVCIHKTRLIEAILIRHNIPLLIAADEKATP